MTLANAARAIFPRLGPLVGGAVWSPSQEFLNLSRGIDSCENSWPLSSRGHIATNKNHQELKFAYPRPQNFCRTSGCPVELLLEYTEFHPADNHNDEPDETILYPRMTMPGKPQTRLIWSVEYEDSYSADESSSSTCSGGSFDPWFDSDGSEFSSWPARFTSYSVRRQPTRPALRTLTDYETAGCPPLLRRVRQNGEPEVDPLAPQPSRAEMELLAILNYGKPGWEPIWAL
ncbi:hypothetical protein C8J56DRAFT_358104 [Mycena floridula]|nr:hypothetical protein C8J56DRAFT_358104 [Mycena floridula]